MTVHGGKRFHGWDIEGDTSGESSTVYGWKLKTLYLRSEPGWVAKTKDSVNMCVFASE